MYARMCVYMLYVCMYVCVRVRVHVCLYVPGMGRSTLVLVLKDT